MRRRTPIRFFLKQCRENFRHTGALIPSSRALARAMTAHVGPGDAPRRILEAGPGTGVFTEEIARRMAPFDRLDAYEINDAFADYMEERIRRDPVFAGLEGRLFLHRRDVLELPPDAVYDRIVSGLPLTNFDAQTVRRLLETFMTHLTPGGVLSYFEYAFIRTVKQYVSTRPERNRLRGVGEVTDEYVRRYQVWSDPVLLNLPPAVARHLVKPAAHTVTAAAPAAWSPAAAVR
jgi:phospholipid N-methyltransferase